MRGALLVGTLIAMLIVGMLTNKRMHTVPKASLSALSGAGIAAPKDLGAVPAAVQKQLEEQNKANLERAERSLHTPD